MFGGESPPPASVERERGSSQIVIHRSADSSSGALTCDRQQSTSNGSTSRPSTTLRYVDLCGTVSRAIVFSLLFIFSAPLFANA